MITKRINCPTQPTRQSISPQAQRLRGFTLIELLVTLAVAAVLLGIAVPAYNEMTLGSKLRATANKIVSSATMARGEAVKRNTLVSMCVSTDGATCTAGTWEQGWIVVSAATATIPATVIHREQAVANGFKVNTDGLTQINFPPSGVSAGATVLTVCRATPSVGSQEREVTITATGRTSVEKKTAGACP